MPDRPELDLLRAAEGRPYRVALSAQAEPAPVIMAYTGLRPVVLWGSWLDSEVIIAVDPLVELAGLDAVDCWGPLATRPRLTDGPVGGIGGGWFTVLGYDPGTSWLAFCDSVLRRRSDGSWVFETLGLSGREEAAGAALDRARAAVGRVGAVGDQVPVAAGIGPLSPLAGVQAGDGHIAGVERVIGRIRAGEVYQLNLCTRLGAKLHESPLELFVRTVSTLRPAYGAHLPTGSESALVSLSPERFLTVRDGVVTTSPIKGTTKRGEDSDGSRLRSSAKDAAENVMITDLMRNDLSRVCATGSVAVTGLLEVRPHPGVWHLVSTVTGRLAAGATPADLLSATFPPGSVTGAPKSSAVRAIEREEPHARGAYTGAAGLITPDGRVNLSVLIRTFETCGDRVELGVGGGITVDSVPVLEWRECLHKAEPLARAAGGRLADGLGEDEAPIPEELKAQGVFESILVQDGRPLRPADHLARLARSVRELYAAGLPDDLTARVLDLAATDPAPRVALRVHARPTGGGVAVAVSARPLGPRLESCALAIATRPGICWRHKWFNRAALQAAERQTASALPYFLDPDGRLAETSRGNLFVLGPDAVWRTPPASDHLLPGVTRRALLDVLGDRGVDLEVAPITEADLLTATAAVWTSSLSGVVAVLTVDGRTLDVDRTSVTWTRWVGAD